MDKRIKDLIEFTKEKYGLTQYYLHKWDIVHSITIFSDTVYRLSMEWFPDHIKKWDDETANPEGTAYIEIDIHSKNVKCIIFSEGKSYADSMTFNLNNKDGIIKWIEKETGLIYGGQFEFWEEKERELSFKECIDGISVSPSGYIQFKIDKNGALIFFSVIGQFPDKTSVKRDVYVLSPAQVKESAKEQLKLFEFPITERKKLLPVFALEEIYIKNDCSSTLPCGLLSDDKPRLTMDKVIEWVHPVQTPFYEKAITFTENVITPEQAFRCEPHPNLQPITKEEIKKCLNAIQLFLSQVYVNDTGKWILKSLYRDKGYIHAALKFKGQTTRIFKRKMILFIDPKTYEVSNYMDNKTLLEIYLELKETDKIKVMKEDAFEKLIDLIELKPYYVYDAEQGYYILCGKLDCSYAVNACNGEIVTLSEL